MRFLIIILSLIFGSCLSFKGVTISPDIKTYYVELSESTAKAINAPSEINQQFSEALRRKIREQSRLTYSEQDPHVSFYPFIESYKVNSVAPVEGNLVAFNRLDITIKIEYENILDEEDNYSKNFNAFRDFEASTSLQDVESGLIEEIFEDITERVFNDTYSDW